MAEPVTMETARALRGQDSPLPALSGPVIKLLFEQIEDRDEQAAELKRRACFAHALCYELSKKHPEVPELGDDGALHCAIHAILAVDISAPARPAPTQLTAALPGEGVPAPWVAPPVPSRFQIGEQVRGCGVKGTVEAVTFTVPAAYSTAPSTTAIRRWPVADAPLRIHAEATPLHRGVTTRIFLRGAPFVGSAIRDHVPIPDHAEAASPEAVGIPEALRLYGHLCHA